MRYNCAMSERELLERCGTYMGHKFTCDKLSIEGDRRIDPECTCGLDYLLLRIEEVIRSQPTFGPLKRQGSPVTPG